MSAVFDRFDAALRLFVPTAKHVRHGERQGDDAGGGGGRVESVNVDVGGDDGAVENGADAAITDVPIESRYAGIPLAISAPALQRILQSAPARRRRCCERCCLDAIERQEPGWIERQVAALNEARIGSRQANRFLARQLGEGPRPRGGVPLGERYCIEAARIHHELYRRGACTEAMFCFVSRKFAYKNLLIKRPQSLQRLSSQELLYSAPFCCGRACVQVLVRSRIALDHLRGRAKDARCQKEARDAKIEFFALYPRACMQACKQIMGGSNKAITRARQAALAGAKHIEHGLVNYRLRVPPQNINVELERAIFIFLNGATAGNPTSTTGRVHILSFLGLCTQKGLWRYFTSHVGWRVKRSTFNSIVKRWLVANHCVGFDRRVVDHNVCPTCKDFAFKTDRLTWQIREAEMRELGERPSLGDQYIESESISADVHRAELQELELEKAAHFRLVKAHRRITDWWTAQGQFAAFCVTKMASRFGGAYDQNMEDYPDWCSNGGLVVMHVDGEAGRKIPTQRFETTGGGFEGRRDKNIAFKNTVTNTMTSYLLPQFHSHEDTNVLMNLILHESMRTRGEEALVLVFDTCSINYSPSLWLLGPHLVDELQWFRAVVFAFYHSRHGKGPADKEFGNHYHQHRHTDALCSDHLAHTYENGTAPNREQVFLPDACAFVDYKNWLVTRSNGRTGSSLRVRDEQIAEVVVVRERMMLESRCHPAVLNHLKEFVTPVGYYAVRGATEGSIVRKYCVRPSETPVDMVVGPPPISLKNVTVTDADPVTGISADPTAVKYPLSRTNLLIGGYNNARMASVQADISNVELKYGSPIVPPTYSPTALVARARNFAFRQHSLGEREPIEGLFPPLEELNCALGRELLNTDGVTFMSVQPRAGAAFVAGVDKTHSSYLNLQELVSRVKDDPGRNVTVADLVQAAGNGFSFDDPPPTCDRLACLDVVRHEGRSRAFRRLPAGTRRDPMQAYLDAARRFARPIVT